MNETTELTPRTYADLLALWEAAPVWQPPAPEYPAATVTRDAATAPVTDLDYFTERQIADLLQIDVLGKTEERQIEAYSSHLRRTVRFNGLARLKYDDLIELFGVPVKRCVLSSAQDEVPGMYPVVEVRRAIGLLASCRLLSDETKLGLGCWPVQDEAGRDEQAVVLVNASEAMHYNGHIERITHPRHRGQLLSFESGAAPWYDYDQLVGLLEQANDAAFREKVADDLVNLFRRWRWQGKHDAMIASGLALATWVQTIWSWRPRIDVLGASNTGKSMLCGALAGLFHGLVIMTSDTTAAGLRQKICNSASVVIVDEVDAKNRAKVARQREILEMLRSASRGTAALRGTGSGKAMEFTLRHLVWVAGISLSYDDQADRNRAIILNLQKPLSEMAGKLRLPSPAELRDLGQRSLAAALWACQEARKTALALKDEKIDDVDQRLVESYAVPAAMVATLLGMDAKAAAGLLQTMLLETKQDTPVETDEATLISDVLTANVQWQTKRKTVAQALDFILSHANSQSERDEWSETLESYGIRIFYQTGPTMILFAYRTIKEKLLRGSRWEGQPIDQYLRRVTGAEYIKQRVGKIPIGCIAFQLDEFLSTFMGQVGHEQQNPSYSESF
jgi:hypothetical protein